MGDPGIVIVTYNSAEEIGPCLDAAVGKAREIVVVDNASTDGTVEEARRRGVRVIANPTNRGFAAAVNQGVGELASPFILLLNPDAVLQSDVASLVDACGRPCVAGAGGRLVGRGGKPQRGFQVRRLPGATALILESLGINRLWPSNPVNWHYRCYDLDDSIPGEVEQPAGALLMIRRDVWQELGGFDEQYYPIWFEDVDFAKRAKDAGFVFFFSPATWALHAGGHSAGKIRLEHRLLYWYRSLFRYTAIHFTPLQHRVVCVAVIAGSVLRAAISAASGWSLRPVTAYWRVIRLALWRFWRPCTTGLRRPAKNERMNR